MELQQKLVTVKPNDRNDLLNALKQLSDMDKDFNGNNGPEYRWQQTADKNFESNQQYVLDCVKDMPNECDCVREFFKLWMIQNNYYKRYKFNIHLNQLGYIDTIAFAYVTE